MILALRFLLVESFALSPLGLGGVNALLQSNGAFFLPIA